MEIILLKDIDKLGYKHDIVTVKNGYGRNYLIPQGFGMIANKLNRGKLEEIIAKEEAAEMTRLEEYKEMAAKLEGQVVKIGAKAGASGKIFGSVNSIQFANALKEQYELEIERKKINLPEEIKMLGNYTAVLNLHPEVECKVEFEVFEDK